MAWATRQTRDAAERAGEPQRAVVASQVENNFCKMLKHGRVRPANEQSSSESEPQGEVEEEQEQELEQEQEQWSTAPH